MACKKRVLIELSLLEVDMIIKIRRYDYGVFKVHKQRGEPQRVEMDSSEKLSEKEAECYLEGLKSKITQI